MTDEGTGFAPPFVGAAPCGRPKAFPLPGGRCPRRGRMRVGAGIAGHPAARESVRPLRIGGIVFAHRRGGTLGRPSQGSYPCRAGACPRRRRGICRLCRARPPGRAAWSPAKRRRGGAPGRPLQFTVYPSALPDADQGRQCGFPLAAFVILIRAVSQFQSFCRSILRQFFLGPQV